MILFYTSYDAATSSNFRVLSGMRFGKAEIVLPKDRAVRPELERALRQNPLMPLFLASHGTKVAVMGNDRSPAIDLNQHWGLMRGRSVFALACWTAQQWGPAASTQGFTWIGFDRPIPCIPDGNRYRGYFREFISELLLLLPMTKDCETALAFIAKMERMARKLMRTARKKHGVVSASVGVTLEQWKAYVRVWVPDHAVAIAMADRLEDAF